MIIAIANQKGGQGKTTTAQALATGCNGKTLAVDLDPQGNLTFSMGGSTSFAGTYELLTRQKKAAQTIQQTEQGDIIAASSSLALADTTFTGKDRATVLKDALRPIKGMYDHIIIDCPPALNILLVNALMAADAVIIPLTADIYSLQGLYQLKQSIDAAQRTNKRLKIGGVLFVKHSTRTIQDRDLADVITDKCREMNIPVYKTTIRAGVAIREAQTHRQNIFDYAPRAKVTQDYRQLIKEIGL